MKKIDILICIEKADIKDLFKFSLQSCIHNVSFMNNIYIVTNDCIYLELFLLKHNLYFSHIHIIDEEKILPPYTLKFSGWYKQQIIKLMSDTFCNTDYILCLGSDVIIRDTLKLDDFFYNKEPILFYNRYKTTKKHLIYERERLLNVSKHLKVTPSLTYLLGDFILDAMVFKKNYLLQLREYLIDMHGEYFWNKIIKNNAKNLEEKKYFGEWTMYAIFVEEVLKIKLYKKNSNNIFFHQIHSLNDLNNFDFDSKIVHIVPKSIDIKKLKSVILNFNKTYCINKNNHLGLSLSMIFNDVFNYYDFKNYMNLNHIDTQKLLIELEEEGILFEKSKY